MREDIAVALVKLKGYDITIADLGMLQAMFSDYDSISDLAKPYVAVAVERGLVSGYEDKTFKGQQSVTRAETAALIWRANQYGNDNKIIADDIEKTDIQESKEKEETTELEANTLSNNVEFLDSEGISNVSERILVIDDNTFIFYDKDTKSFMKLSKNNNLK